MFEFTLIGIAWNAFPIIVACAFGSFLLVLSRRFFVFAVFLSSSCSTTLGRMFIAATKEVNLLAIFE